MIKKLELFFDSELSMRNAQKISMYAEEITNQRVTQGGYKLLSNIFITEKLEFDESIAEFIFKDYKRIQDE